MNNKTKYRSRIITLLSYCFALTTIIYCVNAAASVTIRDESPKYIIPVGNDPRSPFVSEEGNGVSLMEKQSAERAISKLIIDKMLNFGDIDIYGLSGIGNYYVQVEGQEKQFLVNSDSRYTWGGVEWNPNYDLFQINFNTTRFSPDDTIQLRQENSYIRLSMSPETKLELKLDRTQDPTNYFYSVDARLKFVGHIEGSALVDINLPIGSADVVIEFDDNKTVTMDIPITIDITTNIIEDISNNKVSMQLKITPKANSIENLQFDPSYDLKGVPFWLEPDIIHVIGAQLNNVVRNGITSFPSYINSYSSGKNLSITLPVPGLKPNDPEAINVINDLKQLESFNPSSAGEFIKKSHERLNFLLYSLNPEAFMYNALQALICENPDYFNADYLPRELYGLELPSNYEELSFDEYCHQIISPDGFTLGDATGMSHSDPIVWTPAWGTTLGLSKGSIQNTYPPLMSRRKLWRTGGIVDTINTFDPASGGSSVITAQIPRGTGECNLEMRVYSLNPANQQVINKPVILFHGGSWKGRNGVFQGAESLIPLLTKQGFTVFAPFYRLTGNNSDAPEACTKANWERIGSDGYGTSNNTSNAEAALNFVLEQGDTFNVDTSKIYVAGQSAGAGIALGLAVRNPEIVERALLLYAPTDVKDFAVNFNNNYSQFTLAASILKDYIGVDVTSMNLNEDYVIENSFAQTISVNPENYPDMFIMHSENDYLVPVGQADILCKALYGNLNTSLTPEQSNNYRKEYYCGGNLGNSIYHRISNFNGHSLDVRFSKEMTNQDMEIRKSIDYAVSWLASSGDRSVLDINAPVIGDVILNMIGDNSFQISGTAFSPNGSITQVVAGNPLFGGNCSGTENWTCQFSDIQKGNYPINIEIRDNNNQYAYTNSYVEIINEIQRAPIINLGNIEINGDTISVTGTAADENNDLVAVRISANDQTSLCSGTGSWTCMLSGLPAGNYSGNDAVIYATDSQGNRSSNLQLEFEIVEEQVCEQYTTTLNDHHAAGRVESEFVEGFWWIADTWNIYAVGSGELVGHSGYDTVTLHQEDNSGIWHEGSCPTPQPPVIETINTPTVEIVSETTDSVTFRAIITGNASDPNNDISQVRLSAGLGFISCDGTSSFTCIAEPIVIGKSYLPQDLNFHVDAVDEAGNYSDVKSSPSATFDISVCEEHTADLNEHYAEGRVVSEFVEGYWWIADTWNIFAVGSGELVGHSGYDIVTLYQENNSGIWHEGSCP